MNAHVPILADLEDAAQAVFLAGALIAAIFMALAPFYRRPTVDDPVRGPKVKR